MDTKEDSETSVGPSETPTSGKDIRLSETEVAPSSSAGEFSKDDSSKATSDNSSHGEKSSDNRENSSVGSEICSIKCASDGGSVSDNKELKAPFPLVRILDTNFKSQTEKEEEKHSSSSVQSHDHEEKRKPTVQKKTPIIIREVSDFMFSQSDDNEDDDDDCTEMEIEDNCSVASEENVAQKTIYITQSPSVEKIKDVRESCFDGNSTNKKSLTLKPSVSVSSQNEVNKKQGNLTAVASSSQSSPYNTRFAHMKVGPIFSIPNKSAGASRRKGVRGNIRIFRENLNKQGMPSVSYEKSEVEDTSQESGVCFLCGISFGNDMGILLSVKKPLPLSKIDLVTLLENFSISCASIKTQNLNQVNICNVCHTLVIEGDSSYKHLLTVASEMREHWPYRVMKTNPVFSLGFPESYTDQSNSNEDTMLPRKEESTQPESKRVRGRVGRPPKVKVKREVDDDEEDVNWKPSLVKLERPSYTGRRGRPPKRKRGRRGRPRKVAVKGEASEEEMFTCALCSEEHFDENEWSGHYEAEHKPQLRWVNYKLQKKLKKLILYNIQESFLNEEFNDIMCHACDSKFLEKDAFLEHLRSYHRMVIDEEYITSLLNYKQGHAESVEAFLENDFVKEINAAADGTVIKIEKDTLSEKTAKSLKCKVCHVTLESEKALKEHTDTNHFSLVVIGSDDSKEVVLPEEDSSQTHKEIDEEKADSEVTDKENIESSEFTCEECYEAFESRHKLLEHKLNIHGSTDGKGQEKGLVRYECEVCGRRIYGLAALKVHMSKVHYKMTSSFKFSCGMCIYKSQSRGQLVKHMRNKHEKEIMPSVQCETCGKMYGASYIAKHIATMHSTHTRDYDCSFCDMKFFDMAGLKFHIYHEHANKVWKCNKCPKEFKKYHQLRQHRIFTHSTKVHACLECPKTYKRKSDLTEHIKRLHLQRVVLLCPRCPKQYVNRFKLRNHLMKHHDVPWEDTLARNYARHQRANNCRRTEEGVLEANKDMPHDDDDYILEHYDGFRQKTSGDSDNVEQGERQEHYESFNRAGEEHEYRSHRYGQHQQQRIALGPVKMEKEEEPEEYIEIMEATDAFAKDGVTYVIIEEA